MTRSSGRRRPSLRVRLAVLGLVPVLVPLVALLAVTVVTEEVRVEADRSGGIVVEDTSGVSPWVPASAAALAVCAAAAAWWWAGRAVRPVRDLAELAERTQWGEMDRRLGLQGAPAEIQALADGFDQMLDRLAAAAAVQRQLVEDASHELRTPLSVVTTTADVVRARPDASADELREAVERIHRTAGRMAVTVDRLLRRARDGNAPGGRGSGDLAVLARRVVEDAAPAAVGRGVRLRVDAPEHVAAVLDTASVERAVANLVDNALRHSSAGGAVTVAVAAGVAPATRASVTVTDEGPGIPAADQRQVFDRYWRGDTGGTGIGLSLVRLVADAHEGLDLTSPSGPDGGTAVTMWFRPALPPPASLEASP